MRKIIFPNIIEIGDKIDITVAKDHSLRYLWSLKEDDLFISPVKVEKDFLEYISKVKGFKKFSKILISNKWSKSYPNVDSILGCKNIVNYIKKQREKSILEIVPFFQTSNCIDLSEKLAITYNLSSKKLVRSGKIIELNSKLIAKKFFKKIGLKFVPFKVASNNKELIDLISKTKFKKIIVKLTNSGGGMGNISGAPEYVLDELSKTDWLPNKSKVLVEPYLNFKEIVGSLAYIYKDNVEFLGLDKQIIKNDSWNGMRYPYRGRKYKDLIKEKTLVLAKHLQKMGIVGPLNIDFGILNEKSLPLVDNLYGIEINFRENGFKLNLNLLDEIDLDKINISSINIKLKKIEDFKCLKNRISKIKYRGSSILIDDAKKREGTVIVSYNVKRKIVTLSIFSLVKSHLNEMEKLLKNKLSSKNKRVKL